MESKPKGKFTQDYPSERKDYPSAGQNVEKTGVPPPPSRSGHPGHPGMKMAVEALRLEDFPMDRQGIDYAVGDIEVDDGSGNIVAIRDITDDIPDREYASAEEVAQALRHALQGKLGGGPTRKAA